MMKEERKIVKHSSPAIDEDDRKAVCDVLLSGKLSVGWKVKEFEREIAKVVGVADTVCTSSGTSALFLILKALGVEGKEVVIPSFSCSALWWAVQLAGAKPRLCEVDETYCPDPSDIKKRISSKTACVVFLHSFGFSSPAVKEVANFGVPVVEAVAQAFGSGAGRYGIASFTSFYATKMITTGEGGALMSDNRELCMKVRDMIYYDKKEEKSDFRFNFKMSDVQAGLGLSQLKKLPKFIERRRKIAHIYFDVFGDLKGVVLPPKDGVFWRFVVRLPFPSDELIKRMRERGVECARPVFLPLSRWTGENFPATEEFWLKTISLPIYPSLSDEDAQKVAQVFSEEYERLRKESV